VLRHLDEADDLANRGIVELRHHPAHFGKISETPGAADGELAERDGARR